MNILIFGASGNTGQALVRQALAAGHQVTAFVRTPAKLHIMHENLKVIQGDVQDYSAVEDAMKDQDAVISALGVSKPLKSDPIVIAGIRNIIKAMEQTNVKRLIYLSFLAVGEGRNDAGFMIKHIISRIVHHEIADHQQKEHEIQASSLQWTIVHPPKLTNRLQKGSYRSGETIRPKTMLPMIARADVADFMLKQLIDTTYIGRIVRVMY